MVLYLKARFASAPVLICFSFGNWCQMPWPWGGAIMDGGEEDNWRELTDKFTASTCKKVHCLETYQSTWSLKYCQDINEGQLPVFKYSGCWSRGNSNGNAFLAVPMISPYQPFPLSILQTVDLDPVQKVIKAVVSLLPYFHPEQSRCWPRHQGVLEVLAAEDVSCLSKEIGTCIYQVFQAHGLFYHQPFLICFFSLPEPMTEKVSSRPFDWSKWLSL